MSTVAKTLKQARKYIAKGWCQEACARDQSGEEVNEFTPWATQWCSMGALSKAAPIDFWPSLRLLDSVVGARTFKWNDAPGRTQAEVLEAFDVAIAHAEGAGI